MDTRPATTTTSAGRLEGRIQEAWAGGRAVAAFRGVPFGAAPVGEHRFRSAAPAPGWKGVRAALSPGPAAPQPAADPVSATVPGMHPEVTSEDCLHLDVWAPPDLDPDNRRPVLVWIHGGAFTIGAGSLPTYDGALLAAEQDVVVVSPNYRLGALGFLWQPDPDGTGGTRDGMTPNCGLSDLMLALRWVRDNAAAFGGDPDNVTVFGESAGAGAILHLLAAPAASGLFGRAILQSPGVSQTLDASRAAAVTDRFLHHVSSRVGGPVDGGRLRTIDVDLIVEAQTAAMSDLAGSVGAMPFHPVVDGTIVPLAPVDALRLGAAASVETVIGTTEDEMQLFATPALAALERPHLLSILRPVVAGAVGHDPGEEALDHLVARYEKWVGADGGGPAETWAAVMTDGLMRLPADRALEAQASRQPATRAYSFTWKPSGPAAGLRSFHAVDLPFTFGTFDREGWREFLGADASADGLSATMRSAWARFARDGRPGEVLDGGWEPWAAGRRPTLVLDSVVRSVEDPLAERREAWDQLAL